VPLACRDYNFNVTLGAGIGNKSARELPSSIYLQADGNSFVEVRKPFFFYSRAFNFRPGESVTDVDLVVGFWPT